MSTWESLPAEFNVATWFVDRNVAQGRGTAPAFHYEDRTLTYGDVHDLVNRTGNALRELGVEQENRVLVLCQDGGPSRSAPSRFRSTRSCAARTTFTSCATAARRPR